MQINGVGNGQKSSMHQATNHTQEQSPQRVAEGMRKQSVSDRRDVAVSVSISREAMEASRGTNTPQAEKFSLSSWLKNALSGGKNLLLKIWGESADAKKDAESIEENMLQTEEQTAEQMRHSEAGQSHEIPDPIEMLAGQEVAATATVRQQVSEGNPYFSAIEDTGREKQSIWEKVRVKFQAIAGQLMGRFASTSSFQTKQEKPKEDLRKHSRYREDDQEIDCILTDDSYLMDSYDRKGEYRKLSAKK